MDEMTLAARRGIVVHTQPRYCGGATADGRDMDGSPLKRRSTSPGSVEAIFCLRRLGVAPADDGRFKTSGDRSRPVAGSTPYSVIRFSRDAWASRKVRSREDADRGRGVRFSLFEPATPRQRGSSRYLAVASDARCGAGG